MRLSYDCHRQYISLDIRTAKSPHGPVRIAVSVATLSDVAGLKLYSGLDVPDGLLASLQMQAGEERDATRARCVLHALGPT